MEKVAMNEADPVNHRQTQNHESLVAVMKELERTSQANAEVTRKAVEAILSHLETLYENKNMENTEVTRKTTEDELSRRREDIKTLAERYDREMEKEAKAVLYSQLETAKKSLRELEEKLETPKTKEEEYKELKRKVKILNEKYNLEIQKETKANLYSQLEKAKKDLMRVEKELDEEHSTKKIPTENESTSRVLVQTPEELSETDTSGILQTETKQTQPTETPSEGATPTTPSPTGTSQPENLETPPPAERIPKSETQKKILNILYLMLRHPNTSWLKSNEQLAKILTKKGINIQSYDKQQFGSNSQNFTTAEIKTIIKLLKSKEVKKDARSWHPSIFGKGRQEKDLEVDIEMLEELQTKLAEEGTTTSPPPPPPPPPSTIPNAPTEPLQGTTQELDKFFNLEKRKTYTERQLEEIFENILKDLLPQGTNISTKVELNGKDIKIEATINGKKAEWGYEILDTDNNMSHLMNSWHMNFKDFGAEDITWATRVIGKLNERLGEYNYLTIENNSLIVANRKPPEKKTKTQITEPGVAPEKTLKPEVQFDFESEIKKFQALPETDNEKILQKINLSMKIGDEFYASKNYTDAILYYEKIISLLNKEGYTDVSKTKKFKLSYVNFRLGASYHQLSQIDLAIGAYTKAKEYDPNNSGAWHELGRAYYEKGDHQKAKESWGKFITLAEEELNFIMDENHKTEVKKHIEDARKRITEI